MKKDLGLLILRVGAGLLMAGHGYGKLMDLFGDGGNAFPDPLGVGPTASLALAVGAEFVCALLVVLGLKTRLAAIPVVFTMVIAAFVIHAGDDLQTRELALLYGVAFLTLALTGGGRYSLDYSLKRKALDG